MPTFSSESRTVTCHECVGEGCIEILNFDTNEWEERNCFKCQGRKTLEAYIPTALLEYVTNLEAENQKMKNSLAPL